MDQHKLGMALQRDHKSIVIDTTPGRKLQFPGGQAIIRDERDMVHLLRRPDLIIHIGEWIDFLPRWLNACGWEKPARAELELPAGYSITREEGVYALHQSSLLEKQHDRRPDPIIKDSPDVPGQSGGTGWGVAATEKTGEESLQPVRRPGRPPGRPAQAESVPA